MAYFWVGLVMVFGKDQRCEKKNDMWVVKGKFFLNFPRTLSLSFAITWLADFQIG